MLFWDSHHCLKSLHWYGPIRDYNHPISQGSLTVVTKNSSISVITKNEGLVLILHIVQWGDEWEAFYKVIQDPRLLPWCGLPSLVPQSPPLDPLLLAVWQGEGENMEKVHLFLTALAKPWHPWPPLTFHWQELVTWPHLDAARLGDILWWYAQEKEGNGLHLTQPQQ